MENNICHVSRLLDFALFLGHGSIRDMAAEAERRNLPTELSDDDLEQLFAAGDVDAMRGQKEPDYDR